MLTYHHIKHKITKRKKEILHKLENPRKNKLWRNNSWFSFQNIHSCFYVWITLKDFFFYIISIFKLSPQVVSRWRDLDSILSIRRIWYRLLASLMVHWVFITKLNIWSGKHTCNRMIVTHIETQTFIFFSCDVYIHTHRFSETWN